MGEPANEYHITAVSFGEQWLEISFYESRDISDDVVTLKSQLISPRLYADEILSIKEDLGDLLDRSSVYRRSPSMRGVPARVEEELRSDDRNELPRAEEHRND